MENGRHKILIVEDNDIARFTAVRIVEKLNCAVDTASSGEQAFDLLSQNKYDLVFMDIGLPGMDGLEVTTKVREDHGINNTVPIVTLTAHDDEEHHERAEKAGVSLFLVKPLTTEKCESTLQQFLSIEPSSGFEGEIHR